MTYGYSIVRDRASGILRCRIDGPLSDEAAVCLGEELRVAMADARREQAPVRLLFDNRDLILPSRAAMETIASLLNPLRGRGDRIALVVSSSLLKVRAREETSDAQLFMSESAALTWLNAFA